MTCTYSNAVYIPVSTLPGFLLLHTAPTPTSFPRLYSVHPASFRKRISFKKIHTISALAHSPSYLCGKSCPSLSTVMGRKKREPDTTCRHWSLACDHQYMPKICHVQACLITENQQHSWVKSVHVGTSERPSHHQLSCAASHASKRVRTWRGTTPTTR